MKFFIKLCFCFCVCVSCVVVYETFDQSHMRTRCLSRVLHPGSMAYSYLCALPCSTVNKSFVVAVNMFAYVYAAM